MAEPVQRPTRRQVARYYVEFVRQRLRARDRVGTWLKRIEPGPALALLTIIALALRPAAAVRRRLRRKPRVIWGPDPLMNIKYWSASLRRRGFDSSTCVACFYEINAREDFDRYFDDFPEGRLIERAFPGHGLSGYARCYAVFISALRRADVFISFFNGGFLRETPLRDHECRLLRLAGRRLVVLPYGGDIAVPGYLGPAEGPLLLDYPETADRAAGVRQMVDHLSGWADVVVRNYQYGYLPRADVLWPTVLAVDTDEWEPNGTSPDGDDDGDGEVIVLHAPNHRHVKGTQALLDAVSELRSEGVPIRLDLREGRPNSEIREAIRSADIVADQFIAGYALFAIEGMACGKPVLSALAWMDPEVRGSPALRECPIVDVDTDSLKGELRRLAEDPAARRELGEAGRRFALSHHSYEAVGAGWEAILDHVWRGAPLPRTLPPA